MTNTRSVIISASTAPADTASVATSVVITDDPKGGMGLVYLEGYRLEGAAVISMAKGITHPGCMFILDGKMVEIGGVDGQELEINGKKYTVHQDGISYRGMIRTVTHDPKTDTIS